MAIGSLVGISFFSFSLQWKEKNLFGRVCLSLYFISFLVLFERRPAQQQKQRQQQQQLRSVFFPATAMIDNSSVFLRNERTRRWGLESSELGDSTAHGHISRSKSCDTKSISTFYTIWESGEHKKKKINKFEGRGCVCIHITVYLFPQTDTPSFSALVRQPFTIFSNFFSFFFSFPRQLITFCCFFRTDCARALAGLSSQETVAFDVVVREKEKLVASMRE